MFENAVIAAIHGIRLSQIKTARTNALRCPRSVNYLQIEMEWVQTSKRKQQQHTFRT